MICALLLCVEAVLPACTGTTAPACRYEFSSAPPGSFGSADFSPDGLLIATSAGWLSDPVVRSTQDGSVVAVLPAEGPKKSVLFSPNGQEIVVACNNRVLVFSTTTWQQLHVIFVTDDISDVAYSHDSAHLAVATYTFGAVYTTSGTLVANFTGHGETISVAFSHDDSQVVSGGADKKARVWSSTTAVESFAMTHEAQVYSVAWSDDGKLIATASQEITGVTGHQYNAAKLWDARDGSELTTFSPSYPRPCCVCSVQ